MTTKGYTNMYSGMQNPERELTEEETNKVKYLISKLEIPYTGPTHPKMGFSGFGVCCAEENWLVQSYFTCWCSVWSSQAQELKHYEDTVGLIAYLEEILIPMVNQHYENTQEGMEKYYEEMFGVPQ
jgi:hypothetical protein